MTAAALSAGSSFSSLHDLVRSTGFVIGRDIVVFVAVLFWLSLAFWVSRDARRRIGDPWLVASATLLGLVPYLGVLVYLLFRPAETLADADVRAFLQTAVAERRRAPGHPACPACGSPVDDDFLVCPVCARQLRQACVSCNAPLQGGWQACPYCAEPIEPAREPVAPLPADGALVANGNGAHHGASTGPSH